MSKKKHPPGPVPPGNQQQTGPLAPTEPPDTENTVTDGTGFNEQDPKRRLGDYGGAGEHPIQQPGGKQAAK